MPISLLFDLANYTPADASPVQANLQQIESYLNTEVITRDGLVAMTAALRLANSTPINPLDAASRGFVDGLVLPFMPQTSYVATSESTASVPFVALPTAQAITMETGSAVRISFGFITLDGAGTVDMSAVVSGATTIPATELVSSATGTSVGQRYHRIVMFSVTPGVNTFTAQFRSTSGVSHPISNRIMTVERLN